MRQVNFGNGSQFFSPKLTAQRVVGLAADTLTAIVHLLRCLPCYPYARLLLRNCRTEKKKRSQAMVKTVYVLEKFSRVRSCKIPKGRVSSPLLLDFACLEWIPLIAGLKHCHMVEPSHVCKRLIYTVALSTPGKWAECRKADLLALGKHQDPKQASVSRPKGA